MVRFRHLAAVTTGLTFTLILLGVYTAAMGAGLSCSAQWPLCDGGVLPQTWPSFVEWFHRLVAMITGFFILGTAVGAWKYTGQKRIRGAATLALAVTPIQVVLGGATVFVYTPLVQVAHHTAALIIFGALLATTLWSYEASGAPDSQTADATAGYPSDD
ncbi:COX15/CtaA family protein [Halorussus lipolyticus]|uniref:COX15/CtaA family protein n=1 Tax=Halorussus lipolyticus TaxID=3034024 RepID=UPI0023E89FA1|nr:COX15/CtaA family protein [Halorussus sp. DT80]